MTANDYNQCVTDYADRLFRFAVKQVHSRTEAEDIVQSVFERFWKHHERVEMAAAKSYLFKSIQRASIDLYRKHDAGSRAMGQVSYSQVTPADKTFENQQLIELALSNLSERQRTMVLLRDYEGYAYKEIAEMMDLTESQIKINLFRARKKLQIFLTRSEQLSNEIQYQKL